MISESGPTNKVWLERPKLRSDIMAGWTEGRKAIVLADPRGIASGPLSLSPAAEVFLPLPGRTERSEGHSGGPVSRLRPGPGNGGSSKSDPDSGRTFFPGRGHLQRSAGQGDQLPDASGGAGGTGLSGPTRSPGRNAGIVLRAPVRNRAGLPPSSPAAWPPRTSTSTAAVLATLRPTGNWTATGPRTWPSSWERPISRSEAGLPF